MHRGRVTGPARGRVVERHTRRRSHRIDNGGRSAARGGVGGLEGRGRAGLQRGAEGVDGRLVAAYVVHGVPHFPDGAAGAEPERGHHDDDDRDGHFLQGSGLRKESGAH